MPNPDKDAMFDGIVKGSQAWQKHLQDIANASAGIDPETGKPIPHDD